MRQIIVLSFITLDGVMQAPGGPEEDTSDNFKYGGWVAPYFDEVKALKETDGPDLQVHGSGQLVQALLSNDLVDELWLKTFPLTLGQGKKLFAEGTSPAAFTLTETHTTPSGVIFANYTRAGEVKTGTVGE